MPFLTIFFRIKSNFFRRNKLKKKTKYYDRRWTDHDIKDLIFLLRLRQNWIDNELFTKHYIDTINARTVPNNPN
jgi:hypothetical protein